MKALRYVFPFIMWSWLSQEPSLPEQNQNSMLQPNWA